MTTLLFAIPTWNRPSHLEKCVRSIAHQVRPGTDVRILIGDDHSGAPTQHVITRLKEEFPFVLSYRNELRTDYSAAFRTLFTRPEVENAEWVWTFGDDDTLEPNALQFMLEELAKADDTCFFHVAEASRAAATSGAYKGTLFDMCCNFGWIEFTGFITGNITRGPLLHVAGSSRLWPHYAQTAFAQSCALLEVLQDKEAVFLDVPLVRSQENAQSAETVERWAKDQIAVRYTYLSDALMVMYNEGVLTKRVPKKFFRYLVYHLWDRFLTFMVQDYVERRQLWPVESWTRVRRFGEFLADEKEKEAVFADVDTCQGLLIAHAMGQQAIDSMVNRAFAIAQARNVEVYPYGYVEKGTGAPTIHNEPTSSPLPSPSPES